ncbi:hypothetical protein AAW51_0686 [Caldimonas brevitalea]|uniref:3-deoxy-D-arabino-heptulosonate 7-phosphate synthase n=2 Tax=Caldimonas brevitalea TaxID=413882 RepID=A0A0G3BDM2_9BURK|nr:hypothetical protein AAW51_0686 [Caldimonas brevitalea]
MLHKALRAAPRRYRLPPMPADAQAAQAQGPASAIAYALDALHRARQQGRPPCPDLQALFTGALAALVQATMSPQQGDFTYQALVWRRQHQEVDTHVALVERSADDERSVRSTVDAVAHPGKLKRSAGDASRERLATLHAKAAAGDWTGLRQAIEAALAEPLDETQPLAATLHRLLANPALERLERGAALRREPSVQRYRALRERAGADAGSAVATARGQRAARQGNLSEAEAAQALVQIVDRLNQAVEGPPVFRLVRSLRTPGTLGETHRAKAEWDAAIVRELTETAAAEIVLLVEVKTSPAAASADWPRLRRGLESLAQARPGDLYDFPSPSGLVRVTGDSLRRLQAPGQHAVAPQVIYCCMAEQETHPSILSAQSKALLLAEPESLGYAGRVARGESPALEELAAVWEAVQASPRLRGMQLQYETAQAAREAMLHPADLLAAVEQYFAGTTRT